MGGTDKGHFTAVVLGDQSLPQHADLGRFILGPQVIQGQDHVQVGALPPAQEEQDQNGPSVDAPGGGLEFRQKQIQGEAGKDRQGQGCPVRHGRALDQGLEEQGQPDKESQKQGQQALSADAEYNNHDYKENHADVKYCNRKIDQTVHAVPSGGFPHQSNQFFAGQRPGDLGLSPEGTLQMQQKHDRFADRELDDNAKDQGQGKDKSLREPSISFVETLFLYAVFIEEDAEDSRHVYEHERLAAGSHKGKDKGVPGQALPCESGTAYLTEQDQGHQHEAAGHDDGGAAGVFPYFIDQGIGDQQARRNSISPDIFPVSGQVIQDAAGQSGRQHHEVNGQELVQIRGADGIGSHLFPDYAAPAVFTEPDVAVDIELCGQIIYADGPVHDGKAKRSPGQKKDRHPEAFLSANIVIKVFQDLFHTNKRFLSVLIYAVTV